jgi:hypothetical protein
VRFFASETRPLHVPGTCLLHTGHTLCSSCQFREHMLLCEGQIGGIHQYCGSSQIERLSSSRVQHTIQVESSADQPQMCKGLRKIPEGLALRSGLLCVEAEMVGIAQHALE